MEAVKKNTHTHTHTLGYARPPWPDQRAQSIEAKPLNAVIGDAIRFPPLSAKNGIEYDGGRIKNECRDAPNQDLGKIQESLGPKINEALEYARPCA